MHEPRWAETEREEVSGVVAVLASTCNNRAAWVEGLRSEDVQELLLLKINTKRPQMRYSFTRSQSFHLQSSSWSPSSSRVSSGFPFTAFPCSCHPFHSTCHSVLIPSLHSINWSPVQSFSLYFALAALVLLWILLEEPALAPSLTLQPSEFRVRTDFGKREDETI